MFETLRVYEVLDRFGLPATEAQEWGPNSSVHRLELSSTRVFVLVSVTGLVCLHKPP